MWAWGDGEFLSRGAGEMREMRKMREMWFDFAHQPGDEGEITFNSQFSISNAPCPIPNSQFPMPHSQFLKAADGKVACG
ncbi:hypothetical protein JYQ62_00455 [Nostoc sp. UHCC 0702]|nr:hypothetical protein JYQ62_00455 [Nostoc sp. UHCC 0702]